MDAEKEQKRCGIQYRYHRVKSRNLSEKKRRDQFNMLIGELGSMVSSSTSKMDKSTILKTVISFFQTHNEQSAQHEMMQVQENWKPSFLSNEEFSHIMLEALDSFVMVFGSTGKILYTSDSISSLLGYLPSDINSSVFDLVHENDCPALHKLIATPSSDVNYPKDTCYTLLLHMKCGPILSQDSSSYELVQLVGGFYPSPHSTDGAVQSTVDRDTSSYSFSPLSSSMVEIPLCFVAIAKLHFPKLLKVVNLPRDAKVEFTSRHSMEWTFLFLDHRASPIIGYLPFEVLGTSGYDYYHMDDLDNVTSDHETLMKTGEGTSGYYRFLTKGQQWIWLKTRYFISYHQWSSKPEFVVCNNLVVSDEHVHRNTKENSTDKKEVSSNLLTSSRMSCLSRTPSPSSLGSFSSDQSRTTSRNSNPALLAIHNAEKIVEDSITMNDTSEPMLKCRYELQQEPSCSYSTYNPDPQKPEIQYFQFPSTSFESLGRLSQGGSQSLATPNQTPFEDYLRKRHEVLQQQIMMQQEELRRVSEQLMLMQFVNPPNAQLQHGYQSNSEASLPHLCNQTMRLGNPAMPQPSTLNIGSVNNINQMTTQFQHIANLPGTSESQLSFRQPPDTSSEE